MPAAIAGAKVGDPDALRYLYARYADNVYGYIKSIVRDEHEAEDLTQQLFAKLMSAIKRYDERGVPFAAWILRVARNLALDHMRSRRMIPCEEIRSVDDHADAEHASRARDLQDAFARLPEDQREVLYMRHVLGMTPTEISAQLGRSESSVHGLHHRGRAVLKDMLRELEIAPSTRRSA